LLRNARRSLTSLHGHEALSGLLIPEAAAATVTGASLALAAVAEVGAEGVSFCDLVERDPVVLALIPPHIGPGRDMDEVLGSAGAALARPDTALQAYPDPASVAREALRLRIRWLQELTARAAWELGRRLVDVGVLPAQDAIRLLSFGELQSAVQRRTVPAGLAERSAPDDRSLPARFRLTEDGSPVAVPSRGRPRRGSSIDLTEAVGAGGGIGQGPVHIGSVGTETPAGSVLVVGHLDPRLAPSIPRLVGLVAETGNALSHVAILAREHGVPTVVGLAGATERFRDGATVIVDGQAGTVQVVHAQSPHSEKAPAGADFEDEGAGLAINGAPS
jgi:rifampicin phosphotransferase